MPPTDATCHLKRRFDTPTPSRSCHDLSRFETQGACHRLLVPYAQKFREHPTEHVSRSERAGHSYKYQETNPGKRLDSSPLRKHRQAH